MRSFLLVFALVALVFAEDDQYCDTVTGYVPDHFVSAISESSTRASDRHSLTRCKPEILRIGREIELGGHYDEIVIIGHYDDRDEDRIVRVIKDDTFSTLYLEGLVLKQMDVEEIQPHAFRELKDLQYLSLRANKLSSVPAELFDDLPKLKELSLGENLIQHIDKHLFDKATNLERLDVSVNGLSSLPDNWAEGLSNLKVLNLSGNALDELRSGVFDGLNELRELDLSANGLQKIDEDGFKGLDKVEYLSLSGNVDIDFYLSRALNNHLKNLKYLDMNDVRLRCDDAIMAGAALLARNIEFLLDETSCFKLEND